MNFALEIITQKVFDHSRKIAAATSIVLIILMSLTVANSVLTVLEAANPPKAPFPPRYITEEEALQRLPKNGLFANVVPQAAWTKLAGMSPYNLYGPMVSHSFP